MSHTINQRSCRTCTRLSHAFSTKSYAWQSAKKLRGLIKVQVAEERGISAGGMIHENLLMITSSFHFWTALICTYLASYFDGCKCLSYVTFRFKSRFMSFHPIQGQFIFNIRQFGLIRSYSIQYTQPDVKILLDRVVLSAQMDRKRHTVQVKIIFFLRWNQRGN